MRWVDYLGYLIRIVNLNQIEGIHLDGHRKEFYYLHVSNEMCFVRSRKQLLSLEKQHLKR